MQSPAYARYAVERPPLIGEAAQTKTEYLRSYFLNLSLALWGRKIPGIYASSVVDLRMYALANTQNVFQEHVLLRKEVIQPHLPIRLPCYDFVPLT